MTRFVIACLCSLFILILLSLSVWGTLLVFAGLIIALPLTTLCLSYYKRFTLTNLPLNCLYPIELTQFR